MTDCDKTDHMTVLLNVSIFIIYTSSLFAATPDWSHEARLPGNKKCFEYKGKELCFKDGNRENIYNLSDRDLKASTERGARYALNYPVTVSDLQLPKQAMDKFFEADSRSLLRRFIYKIAKSISNFHNFSDFFNWMGLHAYPVSAAEQGPNIIPDMGELEEYPMGVTVFHKNTNAQSMTFSCAACHSADLFGVKILGMTNRFPKANETFILGKKALLTSNPTLFKLMVGPSPEDMQTYKDSREAIKYVEVKQPLALGLDTSLSQVGLSLALRGTDEYATKIPRRRARANPLDHEPADSKPAVWWNLKYKTKWLSDASIDSGNPIHTNFLWNEIGRGVDLKKLESWLTKNNQKVKDLTAYVFQTKAPKYNDFFPRRISIEKAKKGEKLFLNSCSSCHGIYEKGWSQNAKTYESQILTTKIWSHEKTVVKNVGTDPLRSQGMKYFYQDLNRLKISKSIGTKVTPKDGYVPPPLVGIWARWPYFHNNSAPTLMDVLTPAGQRPKFYIATPAIDKRLDFDSKHNGYPRPEFIRSEYRNNQEYHYNTSKKGLSNSGHSKMLFDESGSEKFSYSEKLEIIEYLKTL